MKKTAAIVVTYNRIALLRQCLAHLEAQTAFCDILVVDNASTDGTDAWLREYTREHASVRVHTLPVNSGGAGGFNHGLRWAMEAGYDYAWVMDDDCLPNPDSLERLLDADRKLVGKYGWLSSTVLWTDGSECRMNRQKLLPDSSGDDNLLRAKQATFVSCLFPAEVVRDAGLPIREYFIWGDDVEYTRRIALRMQKPCYVVKDSVVIHAMSGNSGSNLAIDDPVRIPRYHYAFRNENHLYRQEGFRGVCYYLAKCGFNLLKILFLAKDHRFRRCGVILRELIAGTRFRPEVEYVGLPEPQTVE